MERGAWLGYSLWGCKESEMTKRVNNASVALNTLTLHNLSPPSIPRTFSSSQTKTLYPLNPDSSFPPTPTLAAAILFSVSEFCLLIHFLNYFYVIVKSLKLCYDL